MTTQEIRVEGITMRWNEHGSGTPVVLVHGIPTSPALWRHVAPRVEGARLLMWEMVGYGASIPEGRGRDISVASQARYLRAWMRAIDLPSAVLVGHDLGGGVVQIAAVDDPSICDGLVLANAIGYDSWPIPEVKVLRALGGLVERMPARLLRAPLALLMRRGHDSPAMADESLAIHLAPYVAEDGARALVRQVRALHTADTLRVQDRLLSLRGIPARIVWGAGRPFQDVDYAHRFARDLGCELVVLDQGRHFVPEDHPNVVAKAITAVVSEVSRASEAREPAPPPDSPAPPGV